MSFSVIFVEVGEERGAEKKMDPSNRASCFYPLTFEEGCLAPHI